MRGEPELIEKYFDDGLTTAEETVLLNWLVADREHMRLFIREAHFHRQLRAIMVAQPFHTRATGVCEGRRPDFYSTIVAAVHTFRRFWLPAAFCVALAIIGGWLIFPTMGQPILEEVHGSDLTILRDGQSLNGFVGMPLLPADILRTGSNVTAIVSFNTEATRLILEPGTDLTLAGMSHGKKFILHAGKLKAAVSRQPFFYPMLLTTPQAEARVVGTQFTLLTSNNATRLEVREGKVRLTSLSNRATVAVAAGNYATVADQTELAALPFTGGILREFWSEIHDKTISDFRNNPRYRSSPDGSTMVQSVELEPLTTNSSVFRFVGYLHPPVTGDYEFWLSGATDAALYMSPGENPADEVCMATSWDNSQELDKPRFQGASPWAPPMRLVAGRRYYVEAIVLIKDGEGHLSVAWKRLGGARELLTGDFLSPYKKTK